MLQLQVMLQVMQLLCSSVTPLAKATQHSLEPTHEVWPRPSPPPAPLHHAAAHMHAMRGVLTPHPHCTTDPLWEGSTCLHITLRHARVFRRQRPARLNVNPQEVSRSSHSAASIKLSLAPTPDQPPLHTRSPARA